MNGKEYKPSVATSTKKVAKANAAAACLQALGVIPKESPPVPTGHLQTIPDKEGITLEEMQNQSIPMPQPPLPRGPPPPSLPMGPVIPPYPFPSVGFR